MRVKYYSEPYIISDGTSILSSCAECGFLFVKGHGHERYCPECKLKVKRAKTRIRVQKYLENNKDERDLIKKNRMDAISQAYDEHGSLMNHYHVGKGTGRLGPHADSDFKIEWVKVRNEMRYLQLF